MKLEPLSSETPDSRPSSHAPWRSLGGRCCLSFERSEHSRRPRLYLSPGRSLPLHAGCSPLQTSFSQYLPPDVILDGFSTVNEQLSRSPSSPSSLDKWLKATPVDFVCFLIYHLNNVAARQLFTSCIEGGDGRCCEERRGRNF